MSSTPIVIDVGTYALKIGFAGDENGPLLIRNWMGKPKHDNVKTIQQSQQRKRQSTVTSNDEKSDAKDADNEETSVVTGASGDEKTDSQAPALTIQVNSEIDFSNFVFGNKTLTALHDLNIYSFYENNHSGNYIESLKPGLKLFYSTHVFTELLSNMEDMDYDSLGKTNVLLTEQPFCSKKWKSTMNEIMFETLNVKGINYQYSGVLSMYATNRLNGCVLDVGYENSSVIPVIDGCPIENCINRINLAGKHVDLYLQRLLRKSGITLHTDSELERIRQIKEKLCEFSLDGPFSRSNKDDEELNVIRFELPDKKILQIGSARLRAPEVLFSPHLIGSESLGIHELLLNSINKCDVHTRKTLLSNVLITGGTTKINKFGPRLLQEIKGIDDNTYFDYKNVLALRYDDEINLSLTGVGGAAAGGGRLSRAKRRSRAIEDASSSSLYSVGDNARKSLDATGGSSSVTANSSGFNLAQFDDIESRIKREEWKKTKMRLIALEKRDISSWIGGSVLCSMDEINNDNSVFWMQRDEYLDERRKDPNFQEPPTPKELNQLTDDFANELLDDME